MLIFFDNVIVGMLNNKKLNPTAAELLIRGKKLDISLVFITQSYLAALKDIRINSTHYFVMKVPIKQELHGTASNNSEDIDFKDFMTCQKMYCKAIFSDSYYCIG